MSNNIIHELTPRQFALYKTAYQIVRHHSIDILNLQNKQFFNSDIWISTFIQEYKNILKIKGSDRYQISIQDLRVLKNNLSGIKGTCELGHDNRVYMVWLALNAAVDILELLLSECLYDDSINFEDTLVKGDYTNIWR